jgi:SAM-dependent methyltransferase
MTLIMVLQFGLSLFIGSLTGSLEAMIPGTFVAMGAMMVALVPMRGIYLKFVVAASVSFLISLGFVFMDAMSKTRSLGDASKRHVRPASNPPPFTLPTPVWLYDLLEGAGARRRACPQRRLFAQMGERVLFVAAGSGLNFKHFPPHRSIVAIDVNSEMLERAHCRAKSHDGILRLMNADVQKLTFADATFDTVATASTFCSVPDPKEGLSELYRVLKPGGKLLMFEHVRSGNALIALNQDMMNFIMRLLGSNLNRDTASAVRSAGFVVDRIGSAYLDVFLAIESHKPANDLS